MKNDNHEETWYSFFKFTLIAVIVIIVAMVLSLTFLL